MAAKVRAAKLTFVVLCCFLLTGATNWLAPLQSPLPCTAFPALTGDVTTSAGSCATLGVWKKISTQTASAAASIQWTGLGATYNNYVLDCYGVFPSTASTVVYGQVGEGGTPTWQTTNYRWSGQFASSINTTLTGVSSAGVDSGFNLFAGQVANTAQGSVQFHAIIHNMISTSIYTEMEWMASAYSSGSYSEALTGQYTGDNTAKTAFRLVAASGNINGTCSLWALVPP